MVIVSGMGAYKEISLRIMVLFRILALKVTRAEELNENKDTQQITWDSSR